MGKISKVAWAKISEHRVGLGWGFTTAGWDGDTWREEIQPRVPVRPEPADASTSVQVKESWKLLKREVTVAVRKHVFVYSESSCLHHDPCNGLGDLVGIKKHFQPKHSNQKQWVYNKCSKGYAVQFDYKAHLKTYDGFLSFVLDVAEEVGVPVFYFCTSSACSFWAYFCMPDLIKAQEVPFNGDDLDLPIANVRGMEGILRRRDLPSFFQPTSNSGDLQFIMYETQQTLWARGLILNTVDDLERAAVDQIQSQIPNLYTIGPIYAQLKARTYTPDANHTSTTSSLWEEDRSCVKWRDEHPSKSVIYVSFGSITELKRETQMEFWHGLVNSGKRFLWVIRLDSVVGGIPAEVLDGIEERERIVGWAPQ